ncbi:MAG: winged helix-turn-helix domain-containing protein [Candidatus Micrarchaeota archaeon]
MKISKRESGILDAVLEKRTTAKELSTALGIKKSNLSGYLRKLSRLRLISVAKTGRKTEIRPDPQLSFGFAEAKAGFSSIKLADILIGGRPFLLSFLRTKKAFRLSEIDLPAATAKRMLGKLRSLGLVFMPSKGRYELREDAFPLAGFSRRMLMHAYLAEAETELGAINEARFSFDSAKGLEAVFMTDKETSPDRHWPTAYSEFSRYGISLILAGRYYYANIRPGPTDIIVHTLAISKDARSIAYVSALMIKNNLDPERLLEKKQLFGLGEDFMNALVGFMRSKGGYAAPGFPSWGEVEAVAHV